MKKLTVTLALLMALASASSAEETIKVLILDKGFQNVPESGEKLVKLDRVNGSLRLGDSDYSGDIEVWKSDKRMYLINEIPLEEYVEGVVKAETGKDWSLEALKAQAVIVRTYVLHQKLQNKPKEFHVTSSVLHQLYRGKNSDTLVAEAVRDTKEQILVYDGKPIVAYYHSTSCGSTELPEEVFGESYPYLKSVESSGRLSPYSMWVRKIPLRELEKATGTKDLVEVKIKTLTRTGRADEVALISFEKGPEPTGPTLRNTTVKAKDLRKMVGWKTLPSTDFTVRMEDYDVVFEGKGYGHGVGLCQWTALEMAMDGKSYLEILAHFYPGTIIKRYEDVGL